MKQETALTLVQAHLTEKNPWGRPDAYTEAKIIMTGQLVLVKRISDLGDGKPPLSYEDLIFIGNDGVTVEQVDGNIHVKCSRCGQPDNAQDMRFISGKIVCNDCLREDDPEEVTPEDIAALDKNRQVLIAARPKEVPK
jgi:hypothetical protein